MRRNLLMIPLLFTAACFASQESGCETGRGPSPVPASPTPVATATQTPTPTPSPTPPDCVISFLAWDRGPITLALGAVGEYEFSPWRTVNGVNVKVDDSCNVGRRSAGIVWESSSVAGVVTVGENPYSATLKRIGTGPITISVSLESFKISRTVN